jgi:hypothetical protein
MSKNFSAVLILCMSAMFLAGCSLLRVAGPCYGVGCPAGTEGRNSQYKQGEGPKAQSASAPAATKSATPTQTASAQPNNVQLNAPAQPAGAKSAVAPATTQGSGTQAAPAQPAPPQNANAEAKPSPFHAIGEFFERLIPHHNSGANSGAGN